MLKRIFIVSLIVILLIVVFHSFFLQAVPSFLYVEDKLEKADVILVLAGDGNGERVAQAVKLYKAGWAPKILMSGGPAIWHVTYADNMRWQATSLGVPRKDVIIQDKSKSTYEDIFFSHKIIKGMHAKKVILVTSPFHMRRTRAVAKKFIGHEGIKVIAYPVQKSNFNPDKWWQRHEDTQYVVWECFALVQYLFKGYLF